MQTKETLAIRMASSRSANVLNAIRHVFRRTKRNALGIAICLSAVPLGVANGSGDSTSPPAPCETSSAASPQVARNGRTSSCRPNFLLILTDDHGFGDVSCYQEHSQRRTGTLAPIDIDTPNIDQIGKEGIVYWNMRANATVCSPTRAALLTGKYPDRVGVPGVIRTHTNDSWGHLTPNTKTLPDYLAQAGYHTGIVGKWHLGLESPNLPNERGFSYFHGFLGDMMDNYLTHQRHDKNYMRLNHETITPEGHATELFADWACNYVRERSKTPEQPFFLYLAFNAPHFPIEPPKDALEKAQRKHPTLDPKRIANIAFVEHLDACIGRVMEALKETGLEQNTLVAVTADNGGSLPHGQSNFPWRDGKQSHYDGGLRVPFLIRWPRIIQAGTESHYQGLVFDLFATFLDLADESLPSDLDARSLRSTFSPMPDMNQHPPEKELQARDLYFVRREGGAKYGGKSYEAIIRGEWKLLQNDPYSPLELYHLPSDPSEQNNLAQSNPKKLLELSEALRWNIQRGGMIPWQPNPPATNASGSPR